MNKRIKNIWMLTILSVFLLIALQGYWLYSSLSYSIQDTEKEMMAQVTQVWERYKTKQLGITRKESKKSYATTMYINGISTPATIYSTAERSNTSSTRIPDEQDQEMQRDTFEVQATSIDLGIDAANTYITFLIKPFDVKDFMHFAKGKLGKNLIAAEQKTCQQRIWTTQLGKHATLLHHEMVVEVPLNPIKNERLALTLHLETQPILQGMIGQFIGSIVVVILLLLSFAYLIKVMFWQRHIDEMRSEFVHTMIHELKRPVQTLKMCVSVFSHHDSDDNNMVMGLVKEESDTLTAYLNKLREVIRAEEQIPLTISTFNLHEMLDRLALSTMRNSQKTVDVSVDYQRTNKMMTADREQIANVINNLLENSVKYSAESVNIQIICQDTEQGEVMLSVADNGLGIATEDQDKIWQKFYRGKAVSNSSQPGIGLGLSFVAMVVKAHGGCVKLNSAEGKGTTISMIIPQTKANV